MDVDAYLVKQGITAKVMALREQITHFLAESDERCIALAYLSMVEARAYACIHLKKDKTRESS